MRNSFVAIPALWITRSQANPEGRPEACTSYKAGTALDAVARCSAPISRRGTFPALGAADSLSHVPAFLRLRELSRARQPDRPGSPNCAPATTGGRRKTVGSSPCRASATDDRCTVPARPAETIGPLKAVKGWRVRPLAQERTSPRVSLSPSSSAVTHRYAELDVRATPGRRSVSSNSIRRRCAPGRGGF